MTTNRLTDAAIKKAQAGQTPRRMADGNGMFLEVQPSGSKWWRHKFRFGGKQKLLSLGVYPQTSLAEARLLRDKARRLLAQGVDPSDVRKSQRLARSETAEDAFEAVAREAFLSKKKAWSEGHARRWLNRMEGDVFPWIGTRPIGSLTAPDLLRVARRIESRGAIETSHTVMQQCGQVFRYGVATGRCDRNPVPDLRDALRPVVVSHMAALTDETEIGTMLRAIAGYRGSPVTRSALVLSAMLFQRPGNIRAAEWVEFDFDNAMWSIPSAKMKRTLQGKASGRPHLVPLPRQAIDELKDLKQITGHGRFLYPSLLSRERCMSDNTVNTALRRLGFTAEQMTAHGFRAMARTVLVEKLNIQPDIIEAQLAHAKSGPLGSAYDRAEFLDQRRQMMQHWADHLDQLRDAADAIST